MGGFGSGRWGWHRKKVPAEHCRWVPSPPWSATTPRPPAGPAEFTKNRKPVVQPLAAELRGYIAGRPPREPLWAGTWADRSADLLAAGIPMTADGPERPEVRDFHALRVCFITNVVRAGADLKQAMTLARHSDPKLTAGRYARRG